jgi:signal transduction histidine kinase
MPLEGMGSAAQFIPVNPVPTQSAAARTAHCLARGSGLVGLSHRIEALGGTLEVTSSTDSGTTLLIELPCKG